MPALVQNILICSRAGIFRFSSGKCVSSIARWTLKGESLDGEAWQADKDQDSRSGEGRAQKWFQRAESFPPSAPPPTSSSGAPRSSKRTTPNSRPTWPRRRKPTHARPGPRAAAPTKSRGMSRRTMFNVAVGTAAAAEAAVIGYNTLGSGSVSDHGLRHAGANYTEATPQHRSRGRRHPGRCPGAEPRQLGRAAADQDGRRHLCASTSTPTACWPRSGTGTTATTIRSATISAPSRAPTRCTASSSSTRRRAARTR